MKKIALVLFLCCFHLWVLAQIKIYPTYSIESDSVDFIDLKALPLKIKDARVVMLGEPSHREGNVFELKTRIIKYLIENEGFNAIAFESGIYDLYFAEKSKKENPEEYYRNLSTNIFPIWTDSKEFTPLLQYLDKNRQIKVLGFDMQFSAYSLEEFCDFIFDLIPENKKRNIDTSYFRETVDFMQDEMMLPNDYNHEKFMEQISNLEEFLDATSRKNPEAKIAVQMLESLQQLFRWDYEVKPMEKKREEWTASMNSIRDKQMAENLLWHLSQDTSLKIICWGASAHFANDFSSFNNEEITEFTPMGSFIKENIGAEAYSIAFVAPSGEYGSWGEEPKPLILDSCSYEYELKKLNKDYFFFSTDQLQGKECLSACGEEDMLCGNWSEIFDGMIYMKEFTPTTPAEDFMQTDAVEPKSGGNQLLISGYIYSKETKQPLPFVNIVHHTANIGTMTDLDGKYEMKVDQSKTDSLFVSCVGYWGKYFKLEEFKDTVYLEESIKSLPEVQVKASRQEPAKNIVKKVIENIEKNYQTDSFCLNIESAISITNFDSIIYKTKMTSKINYQSGYSKRKKDLLDKDDLSNLNNATVENDDFSILQGYFKKYGAIYFFPSHASFFLCNYNDVIKVHPMFKRKAKLNNYKFEYSSGTDSTYVIDFIAKRENFNVSDAFYIDAYNGRLHIRRDDYALIKFESIKSSKIDVLNRVALKYKNKKRSSFKKFYTLRYTNQIVEYKKREDGKYIYSNSLFHHREEGKLVNRPNEKFQLDSYLKSSVLKEN